MTPFESRTCCHRESSSLFAEELHFDNRSIFCVQRPSIVLLVLYVVVYVQMITRHLMLGGYIHVVRAASLCISILRAQPGMQVLESADTE